MSFSFSIAPSAQKKLEEIQEKKNKFLRISVESGGCSGFQYKLDLDDKISAEDEVITTDGAKVVIDPMSFELLDGSELQFVEELMGSYFKITNPNASESCGCGGSFGL